MIKQINWIVLHKVFFLNDNNKSKQIKICNKHNIQRVFFFRLHYSVKNAISSKIKYAGDNITRIIIRLYKYLYHVANLLPLQHFGKQDAY
jgi:hypothetical protein